MEKLTTLTMNEKTYNRFAGNLPQPATASVGQVLVVAAVDDDGNVTEVEAVDHSSGGGGDGSPFVVDKVVNIGAEVSITVKEPPKTHALYNGVRLPKIPEDALAQYPYAWIRDNAESGAYDLLMSPTTWYRKDAVLDMRSYEGAWYQMSKSSAQTAAEWPYKQSLGSGNMGISATKKVLWANHDIPDGSVDATDIYFTGSEPVPTA